MILAAGGQKFGKYEVPLTIEPYSGQEFSLSDLSTVEPINKALRDYHDSMRMRVHKETAYLLPLLRRTLTEEEKRQLDEEFLVVDRGTAGDEAREKYERILKQAAG